MTARVRPQDVVRSVSVGDEGRKSVWAANLTDAEYVFVEVYLTNFRVGLAANIAGFSESNAASIMRRPQVRQAIDQALSERFSVSKATIAERLANMAFGTPRNILRWGRPTRNGTIRLTMTESKRLTEADWDLIASVKSTADGGIEVKLVDRLAALEKLARLTGVMRELPEAKSGGGVVMVIGDPAVVLERYANRGTVEVDGEATDVTPKGTHTDLMIAEPK